MGTEATKSTQSKLFYLGITIGPFLVLIRHRAQTIDDSVISISFPVMRFRQIDVSRRRSSTFRATVTQSFRKERLNGPIKIIR